MEIGDSIRHKDEETECPSRVLNLHCKPSGASSADVLFVKLLSFIGLEFELVIDRLYTVYIYTGCGKRSDYTWQSS